jgi:hypothetical protein
MKKKLTRLFWWLARHRIIFDVCPNCASAWTGGCPNPEDRELCIVCGNPKDGKIRGWCYRPNFLHRLLVVNPNFRNIKTVFSAENMEKKEKVHLVFTKKNKC